MHYCSEKDILELYPDNSKAARQKMFLHPRGSGKSTCEKEQIMKAVLISIQPKWGELIASGKKTVEIRKTKPKLETPFKVYIYCTQNTP